MSDRHEIAAAFGNELDPLAEYDQTFREADADPFKAYIENRLDKKSRSERTYDNYRNAIELWKEYMAEQGRHPACPSKEHTDGFVDYLLFERENKPSSIDTKLKNLRAIYHYWQDDPAFPHDTDFNPWSEAKDRVNELKKDSSNGAEYPRMTEDQLREKVSGIKHVRDRLVVAMLFKFGLRAGELANVRLSDIHISNEEVRDHYDEMATVSHLDGRENALYIPSDRTGNKSERPRVLPIDEEMQQLLTKSLLTRPDNGEKELILSDTRHEKMTNGGVNGIIKEYFAEYDEMDQYDDITSKFGRHIFSTHWKVRQNISREKVKYMRGDGSGELQGYEGIDHYLHTYYEDIEPVYRQQIYRILD